MAKPRKCDDCGLVDVSVTMCQGDLVLCSDCNAIRFGLRTEATTSATKIGALKSIMLTPINAIRSRLFKSPGMLSESDPHGGSSDSLHQLLSGGGSLQRIAEEADEDFTVVSGQSAMKTSLPSSQTVPMRLAGSSARISASKSRRMRSKNRAATPLFSTKPVLRRSSRISRSAIGDSQKHDESTENSPRDSQVATQNKPIEDSPQMIRKTKKKKKATKQKTAEQVTLRCGLCMKWIVTEDTEAGAWVCNTCRKLPAQVSSLLNEFRSVRQDLHSIQATNCDLVKQLAVKTQHVIELQDKVCSLQQRLLKQNDQSGKAVQADKSLLLGSSIIKDASKLLDKESNVEVVSISGGTVNDMEEYLEKSDGSYDHVVIVAGGNDCSSHGADVENTVSSFHRMISAAKSKAPSVTVSSILPRTTTRPQVEEVIVGVNSELRMLCHSENVFFADNDPKFTLADGTVNDALLTDDGVHLTLKGSQKLLNALGFTTCTQSGQESLTNSSTHGLRKQQQGRGPRQQRPPRRPQQQRRSQNQHRQSSHCFYCGEDHSTEQCGYKSRVTCFRCRKLGHKANKCRR